MHNASLIHTSLTLMRSGSPYPPLQVVDAATNYRVILTAYCDDEDDDDDSWRNEDPIFLEALITVPAAGEPTFNVVGVRARCSSLTKKWVGASALSY